MDRNDLFAWLIAGGTLIIITHLMTETAKVVGWGAV